MADCFLPDGVFRRQIAFGPGDADRYGRVDPSALLWQMQEIAGGHYEALGQGDAFIRSHGCFWVVTRSELVFCSYPPMGEALFLETWCGRSAHGLYRRHYRLCGPDGTALARGVSVWVLMDAQTRQLAKDRGWLNDPPIIAQPDELVLTRRVDFPAPEHTLPRAVQDSEIDRNGHLNNSLYLRWAADLLPENFKACHTMRTLWIEYKKELPPGQTAVLEYTLADRALFVRGTAEGRDSFLMRCEYDPI